MKVLHIGQMIGGLDVYIRNVITYTDDDFEFVIAHGKGDKSRPVMKHGRQVREYGISLYRELNPLKDLVGLLQAIRIIRRERPDLVHCHSAKGGVIGRVAGFLTHTRTYYTPHAFSFLSTPSGWKREAYILIERAARLDSYLLACSESERALGMEKIHYAAERALAWNNAVPDPLQASGKGGHGKE